MNLWSYLPHGIRRKAYGFYKSYKKPAKKKKYYGSYNSRMTSKYKAKGLKHGSFASGTYYRGKRVYPGDKGFDSVARW